jgi:hypothetical protein
MNAGASIPSCGLKERRIDVAKESAIAAFKT